MLFRKEVKQDLKVQNRTLKRNRSSHLLVSFKRTPIYEKKRLSAVDMDISKQVHSCESEYLLYCNMLRPLLKYLQHQPIPTCEWFGENQSKYMMSAIVGSEASTID